MFRAAGKRERRPSSFSLSHWCGQRHFEMSTYLAGVIQAPGEDWCLQTARETSMHCTVHTDSDGSFCFRQFKDSHSAVLEMGSFHQAVTAARSGSPVNQGGPVVADQQVLWNTEQIKLPLSSSLDQHGTRPSPCWLCLRRHSQG